MVRGRDLRIRSNTKSLWVIAISARYLIDQYGLYELFRLLLFPIHFLPYMGSLMNNNSSIKKAIIMKLIKVDQVAK
ncbi:MAG: hypothetical protein A4E49_02262 [Methanosaeta sp. PtaU1.Bin112]|nr:MAG: hypothetical protein A4E49_02262 [Methanosaeta sp. PtaU1.Bin112]